MTKRPTPAPPFARWPVHAFDAKAGFVWFTEPAVVVSQAIVTHGTLEAARWMQDQIDAALDREARRIAEQGGLLVIHDLSAIQSYDSDARVHWAERIKRRPSGFARAVIARVPATPLIRMAAAGLRLLGTMHVTMKVRIVDDLEPVLREYGVQVPAPLST